MTPATVALTVGTTIRYWLTPRADEASTGLTVPGVIYGQADSNADGSPSTLTLSLDADYSYDVRIDARNAPPVIFEGFRPADGELLAQLAAQGWASL